MPPRRYYIRHDPRCALYAEYANRTRSFKDQAAADNALGACHFPSLSVGPNDVYGPTLPDQKLLVCRSHPVPIVFLAHDPYWDSPELLAEQKVIREEM